MRVFYYISERFANIIGPVMFVAWLKPNKKPSTGKDILSVSGIVGMTAKDGEAVRFFVRNRLQFFL